MVDDSLAAMDGALYEETVVQTHEKGRSISADAHADVPILGNAGIGAGTNSAAKTEITKQAQITDAAKFQRVYAQLEREESFQYYDAIDSDIWENFARDDLLELELNISPTCIGLLHDSAKSAKDLADLAELLTGQSPIDEKTQEAIKGFQLLGKIESEKGIPVKMKPLNDTKHTFIAYLNPEYMRTTRDQLVGEVTVFCKVQRKLKDNEALDLFNPLGALENFQKIGKSKKGRKSSQTRMPRELRDTIKAPAAVIIPLAIYR